MPRLSALTRVTVMVAATATGLGLLGHAVHSSSAVETRSQAASTSSSSVMAPSGGVLRADADDRVVASSGWRAGSATVSGQTFGSSLSDTDDDGYLDVDVGRSMSRFSASLGIADDSESTDGVFGFRVLGDGIELAAGEVRFGEVVPVDVTIDGVLRLRFELDAVSSPGPDTFVLGNPTLFPVGS